ncbi:hypothetical protein HPB52_009241 [Rhipicephalus sanguineus]|uniref:Uncharacterized protein n=1 Tax=Rhipicephalus sanguineus TaxID=34632 RepID=A0A9D4T926_RHISA|nr:hypothetical protein HPB52_009241 [Rhipicephalus sanguineus]
MSSPDGFRGSPARRWLQFEPNVASFSSHQAAKGIEEYDLTPRQQPRLYDRGPSYHARAQREQPRFYTRDPVPDYVSLTQGQHRPYYHDAAYDRHNGFRELQRPVTRVITNFLVVRSGLGFVSTNTA